MLSRMNLIFVAYVLRNCSTPGPRFGARKHGPAAQTCATYMQQNMKIIRLSIISILCS